ncbi:zinc finger and BTB domain-containing protein 14 isoform X10 [Eurytemora carolleeae]|uniref:zinc finger and BTB domain-containing protein 14 isoform X10 n=1 Tax=Eurytemora carolleeae TaxID=1294199 RepID=UPI000C79262F|nr:zinc finger and BTB domain-containing protein 14 isoform X10 [Eurytemora carolleeae]XP_023332180.1 zinc finger and BTB domain-containing protein 14 isoform X10 [Eurytemora carolleeae]|eukprot:XP_023332179.1 zinc finger and BTB domain-containing protein 14-like isoform X10 [Eurytemora affinis]
MGAGEDFLLKWNDHHSLFFAGAEELCDSEEYTDVTLAAGQRFFSAHKLVLSICSPFFRALFKRLGVHKSVIFLKDVEPRHLELLLEYMYKGEIKVQESELVNVLNAAQSLEIKGLTDSGQKTESSHSKPDPPRPVKRPSPGPAPHIENSVRKRPRPEPTQPIISAPPPTAEVNVKEEQEVIAIPSDTEWVEPGGGTVSGYNEEEEGVYNSTVATGYEEMGYEGEEYYNEEGMMNMGEGDDRMICEETGDDGVKTFVCTVCGKVSSTRPNAVRHAYIHTGAKPYPCGFCDTSFNDQSNRKRHMRRKHQME